MHWRIYADEDDKMLALSNILSLILQWLNA